MTLVDAVWDHWEDYRAGLYGTDLNLTLLERSRALLRDPDAFLEAATEMVRAWPNATHHNLSNMWSGRKAWLGQATCCYVHGATSRTTRMAWGDLTNEEQRRANGVAELVREAWERGTGAQALLDL